MIPAGKACAATASSCREPGHAADVIKRNRPERSLNGSLGDRAVPVRIAPLKLENARPALLDARESVLLALIGARPRLFGGIVLRVIGEILTGEDNVPTPKIGKKNTVVRHLEFNARASCAAGKVCCASEVRFRMRCVTDFPSPDGVATTRRWRAKSPTHLADHPPVRGAMKGQANPASVAAQRAGAPHIPHGRFALNGPEDHRGICAFPAARDLAREPGFEPGPAGLEADVLPLHHTLAGTVCRTVCSGTAWHCRGHELVTARRSKSP